MKMKTKAKYLIEELKKVNALLEANKEVPVKEILLYIQDAIERGYAFTQAAELVEDSLQIDIKNKTVSGVYFNVSPYYDYTDTTTQLEMIAEDLLDELPEEIEEKFGVKVELDYDTESGPEIKDPYAGEREEDDEDEYDYGYDDEDDEDDDEDDEEEMTKDDDDDDDDLIPTEKLIISIK